jgi:hypothetical protein
MTPTQSDTRYNVVCLDCGAVFVPRIRTPLWWRAKKLAESGRLDALHVSGEECGCVTPRKDPDAPYRVFGYQVDRDFDIPFFSLTDALAKYRELAGSYFADVWISGISPRTQRLLERLVAW